MRVAGLVSGGSADGIDAVLADVERGESGRIAVRPLTTRWNPHPAAMRRRIVEPPSGAEEVARLHWELGACLAEMALGVMSGRGRADLVGAQGQTVGSLPGEGTSLQLGEAAAIVERTGVPVIANFRSADLAAGGRGGPLAAFADWHLLADAKETRACLNLGSVATVTLLPAGAGLEEVTGFDVGPGMLLIDLSGGDPGGAAALLGSVHEGLLDELRGHPFLRQPPPKSWTSADGETGIGLLAMQQYELSRPDLMATLAALTADSVEEVLASQRIDRLLISGGGVYNRRLVQELGRRFRVLPTDAFGIGARAKEALVYAVLAFAGWHRIPASLPRVTGARHSSVLGQLSLA